MNYFVGANIQATGGHEPPPIVAQPHCWPPSELLGLKRVDA
jgi:hypothetical protein